MSYLGKDGLIHDANKEIMEVQKGLEGWSERIIKNILAPLKENDIELLPRGKDIPHYGNKKRNI